MSKMTSFFSKYKWEIVSPIFGGGLALSFAPYDYWLLGVFSLIFAFFTWNEISPRRAALRGFLYGVGLYGIGVSWVYISIHDYGGAHFIGAGLLTAFFVLFWTIFPSLTAYLIVKFKSKNAPLINALIASVTWILIEYGRGYLLLNGFPWLQVAYSQLDTPIAGYIPLVGSYGTGFILLLTIALITESIKARSKWKRNGAIVLLIWGTGYGFSLINWTESIADPIKVTLVQGNVRQDKKWLPEYRIKTLLSYQQMTEQHWDSDVIVWPETAIPAFLHQVEAFFLDPLERQAQQNSTDLVVSLPAKGQSQNENFNMVITLGKERGEYKKNHLLPFGEYLPLQPLSGFILDLLGISLGNFTAGGDNQPLMQAGGYRFAASICYEDAFGSVFTNALPEAKYLVNVTNDAWFGDSLEPHQHLQIARMRALETGRYLLRATNTGATAIIDHKGKIVIQAPLFKKTVITGNIYPREGMTPYAMIKDKAIITVLLLFAIICLAIKRLKN